MIERVYRALIAVAGAMVLGGIAAPRAEAQDARCGAAGINPAAYRRVLNRQFASVINPQSANSIGNFGAYDSKDGKISFAASSILSQAIVAAKVSGAGTGGVLPIFDTTAVSKSFGADLQIHLLDRHTHQLRYTAESCDAMRADSIRAEDTYAAARIDGHANGPKARALLRLNSLDSIAASRQALIARTASEVAALRVLLTQPVPASGDMDGTRRQLRVAQLRLDSLQAADGRDGVARQAAVRDTFVSYPLDLLSAGNVRARAITAAEARLEIVGFTIGWWSFGYGVSSTAFKLFVPTAVPDSQLSARAYVSHEVRAQYSRYRFSDLPGRSQYWTAGVAGSRTDNFDELTKVQLTEVMQYTPTTDARTSTKSYAAYRGAYERDLNAVRLFADFYQFFFTNNNAAVHVFPSLDLREHSVGVQKLGLGFSLLFTNPDKTANRVNAELYYQFDDLHNVRRSKLGLFERGQAGVRFSLPITFSSVE